MKLYRRFSTTWFPWRTPDEWELVCHCVDKDAAKDYINSSVSNSAYEFKLVGEDTEDLAL